MTEPIRLSALGRHVRVGDLYNYFNDVIVPSEIPTPSECKLTPERVCTLFYQQPDKFKSCILGISSHLQNSIKQGILDLDEFWFANYLKPIPLEEDTARVDVFIKVIQRTEFFDQNLINSKMYECKLNTRGSATHLVEQVVYGAEFICSMRRKINRLKNETKETAEERIYWETKEYFDQIASPDSVITTPTVQFDVGVLPPMSNEIYCKIFSSLKADHVLDGSFQQSISWLKKETDYISKDDRSVPIEIVLQYIPEQIETLLQSEKMIDKRTDIERDWHWIVQQSSKMSKFALLDCVLPLAKVVNQFRDLLDPLWNAFEKSYENINLAKMGSLKQILHFQSIIQELLWKMTVWLQHLRYEIETICPLLNGTSLVALDFDDLKTRTLKNDEKIVKVFVLKVDYKPNPLIEHIQKIVDHESASAFNLPSFSINKLEGSKFLEVKSKLVEFENEATLSRWGPNRDTSYYIGLVPISSPSEEGAIEIITYSEKASNTTTAVDEPIIGHSLEKSESIQLLDRLELPPPLIPTVGPTSNQQNFNAITFDKINNYDLPQQVPESEIKMEIDETLSSDAESIDDCDSKKNPDVDQDSFVKKFENIEVDDDAEVTPARTSTASSIKKSFEEKNPAEGERGNNDRKTHAVYADPDSKHHTSSPPKKDETTQDHENLSKPIDSKGKDDIKPDRDELQHEKSPNRRIAEIFSEKSGKYSKLIKNGQPNVYELNAKETLISEDFRCFDMGQQKGSTPSNRMRNHKVIILMGATGCGKSTLINGMVNYILGVQWGDPFRFKCVREDETIAKNQAHSQTSSVTAYTLRHHQGMAVPYSITIIDTPGYGDTRGVKRDKEITGKIHQFLTQQETHAEEIHAACFVAASGNSRLTATQGYIIDSVLSIFGKDFKENIRLLVTFADNAHPPVVEACLAANFPVTSISAGITFSKFNSSVLYANNKQEEEDDFCFDELFWDMGQENFLKFFTMLEKMNGCNLKSTRNVIQSRKLLEQSLKCIEQELEVCLVKIENMEIFQRKMKQHGYGMESNKHFIIEQTEMRPIEVTCDKGFFAYNCRRCKKTCERPIKQKNLEKMQKTKNRMCDKQYCTCPASEHEFQPFEWRMTPEKITTTLKDMKAEYESNYNDKITVEQLLANCNEELNVAKAKVFSLLDQVDENVRLLESTALRSSGLTPSDYLSMMKSRVAEEQAPGYLIRLDTLTELQNYLAADASGSASHRMTARSIPNQTQQLSSRTGGAHQGGENLRSDRNRSKSSQFFYQQPTGATNDSTLISSRTASGNQPNNNQLPIERLFTVHSTNSNSREHFSSDNDKAEKLNKNKKGFLASITSSITAVTDSLLHF